MNKITHIGSISSQVCNDFMDSIFDVALEDIDRQAIGKGQLFEAILPRELPISYTEQLVSELQKHSLVIDVHGNMSPILCQSVSPHRDQIRGSQNSIIINVSNQTGEVLLHDKKDGAVTESISLERGRILGFNHFSEWHSIRYTGDIGRFLVIVRASVIQIMR